MLNRIWIYAVAVLASGCTTALYSGPSRPSSEVVTFVSDDSVITQVDGKRLTNGGNFWAYEVLPGEHAVGVQLNEVGYGYRWYSNELYTICLWTEAGKTYRVQIERHGNLWRPYMIDDGSKQKVSTPCGAEPRLSEESTEDRPTIDESYTDRILNRPLKVTPKKK